METVVISGDKRELGSKSSKQLRKDGKIPCVVYGKEGETHFSVHPLDVREIVYTPDFKLAQIDVDGVSKKAILKDIQFHPVTDEIEHIDFLELYKGHPVKVNLPVAFEGVSKGVKDGGRLVTQLRTVPVKTLPENLVDHLLVNISDLGMGEAVRVKEIKAVDGVEVLAPANAPIASVQVPRALKSLEAAAAKLAGDGAEVEEDDADENAESEAEA